MFFKGSLSKKSLKTTSPAQSEIKRKWLLIDVKGKTVGRAAAKIADILRGKNKPMYSPHLDCGDFIIVINAKDIHFTGNKTVEKIYYRHTRFGNGLKALTPKQLLQKKPADVLIHAVAGMIPHNKLKKDILKKMKVYAGPDHKQIAQQPIPFEI